MSKSEANLKAILESMEKDTPEIVHVVLPSAVKRKRRKSML